MGRPKFKDLPRLTYLINDGTRRLITLEPAKDKILHVLFYTTREELTIREIGELVLSDAYNLAVCLDFIRHIITHLQRAKLVIGKKKPYYQSTRSKRTIWKYRLSKGGRREMQHRINKEGSSGECEKKDQGGED